MLLTVLVEEVEGIYTQARDAAKKDICHWPYIISPFIT
jgi:hypothetical protein